MPRKPKPDPRPEITEVMARSLHARAVELSAKAEENWVELGSLLLEMHEGKLHRKLGYKTWLNYTSTGGLRIKERTCYLLMELVRLPFLDKIRHLPYSIGIQVKNMKEEELDAFLDNVQAMSRDERWFMASRMEGKETHIKRLLKRKKALETQLQKINSELEIYLLESTTSSGQKPPSSEG